MLWISENCDTIGIQLYLRQRECVWRLAQEKTWLRHEQSDPIESSRACGCVDGKGRINVVPSDSCQRDGTVGRLKDLEDTATVND